MNSAQMAENTAKGATFMVASNIAFCAMACLVRYGSASNIYAATFFRFVVGMAVIGLLAMTGRAHLTFVNKTGLLTRGLLGGSAICIGFLSIYKLGMIKSSLILYLYPIFAALFSILLLKERLSIVKIASFIGSFAGVLIVLGDGKTTTGIFSSLGAYETIAIIGSVLAGLSVVLVKKLQATDSTISIYFAQCLVGFWLVIIPAGASPISMGYSGIVILVVIGLLAAVGQLVMTEGYRYIPVSTGSVFVLLAPVLNCLAGVLLFHEPLSPRTVIGSLLVMVCCTAVLWKGPSK